MQQEILDYLSTQRVRVLAVEMLDGSPHGATVHFAHTEDPLVFFFETNREYRKAEPILNRESSRASLVIGSSETDPRTLQLDGLVQILRPEDFGTFEKIYLSRFPKKKEKVKDKNLILFTFRPTWWRYTDWTKPDGKLVLTGAA